MSTSCSGELKIDFQDYGHLGFRFGKILAMFDLQVTRMLPTKFQVNLPFGSEVKNGFSRWWPSWIAIEPFWLFFIYTSPQCLLPSFYSTGLFVQEKKQTRGPWWSYIAHLSKQLCIPTVEVSAKFTALRFLYKFYSPAPQRPCYFSCIMMAWTESWMRITKGTILPRYIEIGPKRFLK